MQFCNVCLRLSLSESGTPALDVHGLWSPGLRGRLREGTPAAPLGPPAPLTIAPSCSLLATFRNI